MNKRNLQLRGMYVWRQLTTKQRGELLAFRIFHHQPWHSPPHREAGSGRYLLSAACFEHAPIVGHTPERMASFSQVLLAALEPNCDEINAWCVLPNHYHALIHTANIGELLRAIGRLHGRISFEWNGEENRRGRKVWFNCVETAMKSARHFRATMNYVHNNPVHHRYVKQWQDWPFSSAGAFVRAVGRDKAAELWHAYPVLDYGKDWDAPEM